MKKLILSIALLATSAAAQTAAVVRTPVTTKIWLPAAGGTVASPSLLWDALATAPAASCSLGTTETAMIRCRAAFLDSGAMGLQQTLMLPADWTGAIDATIKWSTAATTGDVKWQVMTACAADAAVDDVTWNAASTVTDTAKGTTLQTNDALITGITTTGCTAGALLHVRIYRDPADGADTLGDTANLVGVMLTIRRAI